MKMCSSVLGSRRSLHAEEANEYQPPDLWSIPAEYLTAAGLYSNAHVLKCYELGVAAPAPSEKGGDAVVKFSNPLDNAA